MYEQFRNELIKELGPIDNAGFIIAKIDKLANNYTFSLKKNEVAIYENRNFSMIDLHLTNRSFEGMKESTIGVYRIGLRNFFMYMNKDYSYITTNDIRAYLAMYKQNRGVSDRTLDSIQKPIRSIFKWLYDEEYIEHNPCAKLKRINYRAKQREALTNKELEELRAACNDARERMTVEVLYSTGCRVTEFTSIKVNDIDFVNGEIVVLGKGGKYRKVYLSDRAIILINEYLRERDYDSEYLYSAIRFRNKQLSNRSVENMIHEIAGRTDIKKKVTPHVIRHTYATLSLNRGMPVNEIQKILGHSSISTTMIYAETSDNLKLEHNRYV